jgi:hypothetical protein
MITFFFTPYNSPILIFLAVAYSIVGSITVFDFRLLQAKRKSDLPEDAPLLPDWVSLLNVVESFILLAMLLLNWKFALIVFGIVFLLKTLPVLETIGNVLMAPLTRKR